MQVSMSCPPVTNLVPCVLWKGTAKDLVLPQQKEKEFFVFKQIKVIILLSELRLLIFFLLHLLPLTVFLFFLGKMMWKFSFWCNWKKGALPVATNPCVSVLYHCGTKPATGHQPRQMAGTSQRTPHPAQHRQSPPPSLPNVSHKLNRLRTRCSGFLT